MSKSEKKLKEKLIKLLKLAEQGAGGEKVNAQNILENLLKKHGFSISDINDESNDFYSFKYKNNLEKNVA